MSGPMTSTQVFEQVFLQTRAKVLEIAASLDRLARAEGFEAVQSDSRYQQLRQSLEVLLGGGTNRAATIQQIFSDPYDPAWVSRFQATGERPELNPTAPH